MIHINEILSKEFKYYCEVCSNWANELCDCCFECMENIHECEC
jgi:hypothetical protein